MARYDIEGNLEWATRAGGPSNDLGIDVAVLSDKSIWMVGYFYSSTATFKSAKSAESTYEQSRVSAGQADIAVARYDADGTLKWVKRAGGPSVDAAICVDVLPDESAFVAGLFESTAKFGQSEGEKTLVSAGALSALPEISDRPNGPGAEI